MKAIWKAKSGFCTQVDKYVEKGKQYTGPDHVVQEHIKNGLAEPAKEPKQKTSKE